MVPGEVSPMATKKPNAGKDAANPEGDPEKKSDEKELSVRERRKIKATEQAAAKKVKKPKEPAPEEEVRRLRRPPPRPPAQKQEKKSPWQTVVLIILAIGGISWWSMQVMKKEALSEKFNLSLAALDKVYLGCKGFWETRGIYKNCDQAVADKLMGKRAQKVELTVIDGRPHKFTVQAKHKENDKIFQVDGKGKIFLNVNGCLSAVRFFTLTPDDVQALEAKCPSAAPPP